jgi:hypothetical protein
MSKKGPPSASLHKVIMVGSGGVGKSALTLQVGTGIHSYQPWNQCAVSIFLESSSGSRPNLHPGFWRPKLLENSIQLKEYKKPPENIATVLRIPDVYPGSRIWIFSMPRRCETSVPDPCHFETDPGPLKFDPYPGLRILFFSSVTVDSFPPEITTHQKQLKSRFFKKIFCLLMKGQGSVQIITDPDPGGIGRVRIRTHNSGSGSWRLRNVRNGSGAPLETL